VLQAGDVWATILRLHGAHHKREDIVIRFQTAKQYTLALAGWINQLILLLKHSIFVKPTPVSFYVRLHIFGIETLRHQVFCLNFVEFKVDVCMFNDGIGEKYYFPSLAK